MAQRTITLNAAVAIENMNFESAPITIVEPIDLVEGLQRTPKDMIARLTTEDAPSNQFSFAAYKKAAGNTGAVSWDMRSEGVKLDELELATRNIVIENELIAGTKVATRKLQSKGGQAAKVLTAFTEVVRDDIQAGIYQNAKKGIYAAAQKNDIATAEAKDIVAAIDAAYDALVDKKIIDESNLAGWEIWLTKKTRQTLLGMNKIFTAENGVNNELLQSMAFGLTGTDNITINDLPLIPLNRDNFKADGDEYAFILINPAKAGTLVFVNDGAEGGIWTEPVQTGTKDRLTAIKGAATVEFIPSVYTVGDESPFIVAGKLPKKN